MAYLETYTQQPADRLDYDIPCEVVTGDSLLSATVAVTPTGLTVNNTIVGNSVKLWVEAGASGVTYKVEVTVETTLGRKKQFELRYKIKDQ